MPPSIITTWPGEISVAPFCASRLFASVFKDFLSRNEPAADEDGSAPPCTRCKKPSAARNLEADALEQLGYQAESGPWRNVYLTGAQELRNGVQKLPTPNTASPDTVRAMTPEMFFDYLAVHVNGEKAAEAKMVLNFDFGDDGGKYKVELENGVLNHTANVEDANADATISLSRDALNRIVLKEETLKEATDKGDVKITGNGEKLNELPGYMDKFEFWFNIVTP